MSIYSAILQDPNLLLPLSYLFFLLRTMNLIISPKPIPTNIDAKINKGDFSKNTSPTPIPISVIAPMTNKLLFLFLFG